MPDEQLHNFAVSDGNPDSKFVNSTESVEDPSAKIIFGSFKVNVAKPLFRQVINNIKYCQESNNFRKDKDKESHNSSLR